jgi:hypothetical protein
MLKIVSLDPGVTTGYSLGIIADNAFFVSCDQEKFTHKNLWDLLSEVDPNIVVCESFEYRNKARDGLELYSCELIGVVKLFNPPHLRMQTAAFGKGHYNDTKLKKMNLYVPGKDHGRDALRHMLQWFTFGPGFSYYKKQKIMLARTETLLDKGEADYGT